MVFEMMLFQGMVLVVKLDEIPKMAALGERMLVETLGGDGCGMIPDFSVALLSELLSKTNHWRETTTIELTRQCVDT